MKVKLKLDKNAIKNFFIDHAEKVVLGLVLLGVVAIITSAVMGRDKLDKTPSQLTEKSTAAKTGIDLSHNVPPKAGDIDKIAAMSRVPIKEGPYQITKSIIPPLGKLERARGEPPVVAVEQLRVAASMGTFQLVAAAPSETPAAPTTAGGSELRGQRWVALTGLVPVVKQTQAFLDAFQDCRHFEKDGQPEYLGYWVERLEIGSPADLKNPDWTKAKKGPEFIYLGPEKSVPKDWGPLSQEVVNTKYLDPRLCFPLGPLVDGTWDAGVAHPEQIPFLATEVLGGQPTAAEMATVTPPTDAEGFEDRNAVAGTTGAAPVRMMQRGMGEEEGMRGGRRSMMGMRNSRMEGRTEMGSAMIPGSESPEYLLFRYFDFTVEPGKRYIYRVRLAVKNPNLGINQAYLEKPELAKGLTLMNAMWSDPSPAIDIPYDTSTLAVAVEQPKRPTGEPIGSMLVSLWQQSTGQKVYNEFAVERGQFLNFPEVEVKAVRAMSTLTPDASADKKDLFSNMLVVDLAGGKKLPGKPPKPIPTADETKDPTNKTLPSKDRSFYSPGEILVMDNGGTLAIRKEFDDMATVDSYTDQAGQSGPAPGNPMQGLGARRRGMMEEGMMEEGARGMRGRGMDGRGMEGRGMEGRAAPGVRGAAPPGYGDLFGNPPARQTPNSRKQ